MSLIHQVLKDLDGQREVTPGEIIGYADHEYNHRVMIWPALVISILAAVFVLYFSQYFESDRLTASQVADRRHELYDVILLPCFTPAALADISPSLAVVYSEGNFR